MIQKKYEIIKFIKLVNTTFNNNAPSITDYWNDSSSIGFQKDNKLIYVACYDKDDFFYELELLVDDPEEVYISQGYDNVIKEELLEVISNFFGIKNNPSSQSPKEKKSKIKFGK